MKLTTEYAILNVNIDDAVDNNDKVLYTSTSAQDIVNKIEECNCTDDDSCIEQYRINEDGDFYDGSDFDTITNFIDRVEKGDSGMKTIHFTEDELKWLRSALIAERRKFAEQRDNDDKRAYDAMNNLLSKISDDKRNED